MSVLRFVSLIVLLGSSFSSASIPYAYSLKGQQLKINNAQYGRYVRPQLRSIISDFYQMMKLVGIKNQYIIEFKSKTENLAKINLRYQNECSKNLNSTCNEMVSDLLAEVNKFDLDLLQLQAIPFALSKSPNPKVKLNNTELYQIDNQLSLSEKIDKLSNYSFKLKRDAELLLSPKKTGLSASYQLEKTIQSIHTLLEFTLIEGTPLTYREKYRNAWINFFKRIEQNILVNNNIDYLTRNIGDLNFTWNEFHLRMTKGKDQVNPQLRTMIQTIHNRWNSILRIMLN